MYIGSCIFTHDLNVSPSRCFLPNISLGWWIEPSGTAWGLLGGDIKQVGGDSNDNLESIVLMNLLVRKMVKQIELE